MRLTRSLRACAALTCLAAACSKSTPSLPPEGKATPASAPPVLPPAPSGPFNVFSSPSTACAPTCPGPATRATSPRDSPTLEKRSVSYTARVLHLVVHVEERGRPPGRPLPVGDDPRRRLLHRYSRQRHVPRAAAGGRRAHAGRSRALCTSTRAGFEQGFDDYRVDHGDHVRLQQTIRTSRARSSRRWRSSMLIGAGRLQAVLRVVPLHGPARRLQAARRAAALRRNARATSTTTRFVYTDQWVGKLLDFVEAQPWGKRTAIIVTADHGEAFGEHGLYAPRPRAVGRARPRAALLLHARRAHAAPHRHAASAVDLAPTILELAGVKVKDSMLRGRAWSPRSDATAICRRAPSSSISPRTPTTTAAARSSITTAEAHRIRQGRPLRALRSPAIRARRTTSFAKSPRAPRPFARYKELSATIPQGTVRGGIPREKATP